jgi:hypothetical protein
MILSGSQHRAGHHGLDAAAVCGKLVVPAIQNTIIGHWPGTTHLIVLAAYTVVLCRISVRLFRWER